MSKSLEYEYKSYIESDIPDIWARIESSLPEKNVSADEDASQSAQVQTTVAEFVKERKKKKSRAKIVSISCGILAACAAAVIVMPAVLSGNLNKSSDAATATESSSEKHSSKQKKSDSAKKDKSEMMQSDSADMEAEAGASFYEAFDDADIDQVKDMFTNKESVRAEEESCENSDAMTATSEMDLVTNDTEDIIDAGSIVGIGELYFISQYGADGKQNFDAKGDLLRDIDVIESEDGICMKASDIESASADIMRDATGETIYCVHIKFTSKAAKRWGKITKQAADNGECIAIYYDDVLLSLPRVVCEITDGNAVITGIESWEDAEKIADSINR